MFLKVGNTYYASVVVSDSNGNLIDSDSPTMTVHDIENNLYYNGLSWSPNITELVMMSVGGGTYQSQFIADKVGTFKVTVSSKKYSITTTDTLEVYDSDVATYQWQTGMLYTIDYDCPNNLIPKCSILRGRDNKYYADGEWHNELKENAMSKVSGSYKFSFVPDSDGDYGITVTCENSQFYYVLQTSSVSENIVPVLVSHQTLYSPDGSDALVLDHKSVPLSGASVTAFNPSTKEVVGKTVTNSAGEWSMLLKPGKWHFLFEKKGYISVAFERTVR